MSTIAYGQRHSVIAPAAQPRLRLTTRGRVVLTLLALVPLLVAALVFGLGSGGAVAGSEPGTGSFEYVTVDLGQSLWSVAQQVAPAADPRDVIAEIMKLNGLSSSDVTPGQQLAIPARYAG